MSKEKTLYVPPMFPFHRVSECCDLLGEPRVEPFIFQQKHPNARLYQPNPLSTRSIRVTDDSLQELLREKEEKEKAQADGNVCQSPKTDTEEVKQEWFITPKELDEFLIRRGVRSPARYISGWIYFITDGSFIKIGKATNVLARLNSIQSGTPNKLTLLFTIPVDGFDSNYPDADMLSVAELGLHELFCRFRRCGEWFDILHIIDIKAFKDYFGCLTDNSKKSMKKYEFYYKRRSFKEGEYEINISPKEVEHLLLEKGVRVFKKKLGGVIYAVSNGQYVKIGQTYDLHNRLSSLQGSNPLPLDVLFTIPVAETGGKYKRYNLTQKLSMAEKTIHELFDFYRMDGEWFDILGRFNHNAFREYFGALPNGYKENAEAYQRLCEKKGASF